MADTIHTLLVQPITVADTLPQLVDRVQQLVDYLNSHSFPTEELIDYLYDSDKDDGGY